MSRWNSCLAYLALAGLFGAAPPVRAQPGRPGGASRGPARREARPALPLRDVVLFSSGVGFFQRVGRLEGSGTVELSFRAEQVNDSLKSLVLLDPAGVGLPVTYPAKEPLPAAFRGTRLTVD
jgi:hypothetical protein